MLTELRKRQYVGTYIHDKVLATFMGRPPMLARRYSTWEMPLDLSDEQLLEDPDVLQQHIDRLDPDGWNTTGLVYPATWARAVFLVTIVREEILEISLGCVNDSLQDRIR